MNTHPAIDHLAFQQVLISLATRFINAPVEQLDEVITQAQRQIVEFLGATRSTIFHLNADDALLTVLYQWSPPESPVTIDRIIPLPDAVRLLPVLREGNVVRVDDCRTLPDTSELKHLLARLGLITHVTVPICERGELFGLITISWQHVKTIDEATINLLRVVGEIFVNAMERKRREEQIQQLNAELEERVARRTAELRQSESQLQTILTELPIPLIVFSDADEIIYMNSMAEQMIGLKLADAHHYSMEAVYANPADRKLLLKEYQTQGYLKNAELHYRTASGETRYGLLTVRPIQFGGQSARLASIVDVTELKQTQEAEYEQRRLSEALLETAMVLTSTLDLDEVVNYILTGLYPIVPHDLANIMIIEDGAARVVGYRNYHNPSADTPPMRQIPLENLPYISAMVENATPVVLPDVRNEPRFRLLTSGVEICSYVGLPVVVGMNVIGVINVGSCKADFFTSAHISYLQLFALQAGIAIQNARLYDQAQKIAALEERQRLARDLHDSVTQTLFSANTLAEALPRVMERDMQKARSYLHELHQFTRGAMAEMRSLLVELRPDALIRTEFGVLLNQLCDVFTGKTQIEIERHIRQKLFLSPEIQVVFYRVAQEALNNIAKHAGASCVTVELHTEDGFTDLLIRDNGRGFEPQDVPEDHFGLRIMRERAAEIHAELVIRSQPGGTEIKLRRQHP